MFHTQMWRTLAFLRGRFTGELGGRVVELRRQTSMGTGTARNVPTMAGGVLLKDIASARWLHELKGSELRPRRRRRRWILHRGRLYRLYQPGTYT